MLTKYEKWLKGAGTYNINLHKKLISEYNSSPKKCNFCNNVLPYENKRNKFCNHTCSASYTNKKRKNNGFTTKNKTKEINCIVCNIKTFFPLNKPIKFCFCDKCKTKYIKKHKIKIKNCIHCNSKFKTIKQQRKTCSDNCMNERRLLGAKKAGKKSAEVQSFIRRSKNEIYFSELCKNKFKNILTNESMFNGWDADIILPDLKIAILWNGVWHYKKITESHSVKQVQTRDIIKIKEIKKLGYLPYIIKDLGKYNKKFVENEFLKFLAEVGIEPNVSD